MAAVLVAFAMLLAGSTALLHDDHCENEVSCQDCVVQCACHSPLMQEQGSVSPDLNLALLGGALDDSARLGSGMVDAIFIPPRS